MHVVLRLTGPLPATHAIQFILHLRTYISLDLRAAKDLCDQFRADETLTLNLPETPALRLGSALLGAQLVSTAELLTPNHPPKPIPPPPPPPVHICPTCQTRLWHRTECPTCNYLLHPSDRTLWNTQGPCPTCGFSYRFDGTNCSHCCTTTHPQ